MKIDITRGPLIRSGRTDPGACPSCRRIHITLLSIFRIFPTAAVADLASFVAIPTLLVFLEEYDDFAIDMRPTLVESRFAFVYE